MSVGVNRVGGGVDMVVDMDTFEIGFFYYGAVQPGFFTFAVGMRGHDVGGRDGREKREYALYYYCKML